MAAGENSAVINPYIPVDPRDARIKDLENQLAGLTAAFNQTRAELAKPCKQCMKRQEKDKIWRRTNQRAKP
jgi:hypothetical protein